MSIPLRPVRCTRVTSPLCLWLNLLGGIVPQVDGANKVQSRLQPLKVFPALYDQELKELPRAGIALLEAECDPMLERGQSTRPQAPNPAEKTALSTEGRITPS